MRALTISLLVSSACAHVGNVGKTCSLYEIQGDKCGQSDLSCEYTKFAAQFEPGLKDGTCPSQGFTVKGDVKKMNYPMVGEIDVTTYTKPAELSTMKTCSLYEIKGDKCGQSDLSCDYTEFAKQFEPGLKDGTCPSQGFTVKGEVKKMNYPMVGEIDVTTYTKPAELSTMKTCSLYEIKGDKCGQSDLSCDYTEFAKQFEPGLKDGTCPSQGFTVKGEVKKMNYPMVGEIDVTAYSRPAELFTMKTCSLYEIKSDKCGQSDLSCNYTEFARQFEPGLKDGTCPSQGFTVKGEFKKMNYPMVGEIDVTEYAKPAESTMLLV